MVRLTCRERRGEDRDLEAERANILFRVVEDDFRGERESVLNESSERQRQVREGVFQFSSKYTIQNQLIESRSKPWKKDTLTRHLAWSTATKENPAATNSVI